MKKLWIVLPFLTLLTACGAAPSSSETSSTPQVASIPEADPVSAVRVQKASIRTARAAPRNENAVLKTDITSVVFSRTSSPSAKVEQWRRKELRLDNNLTVTLTEYNRAGRVLGKKNGRLSEKEYLELVGALRRANYNDLNSLKRTKYLPGSVSDVLTVSTGDGFRQFKEDDKQQFPAGIQAIFSRYTKAR